MIGFHQAIKLDTADATLYSNRSLCYLKVGEHEDALCDADACIRRRPEWQKAYYRKGSALMSLKHGRSYSATAGWAAKEEKNRDGPPQCCYSEL
jgi:tetratricopeptide (TPR) repeat protein